MTGASTDLPAPDCPSTSPGVGARVEWSDDAPDWPGMAGMGRDKGPAQGEDAGTAWGQGLEDHEKRRIWEDGKHREAQSHVLIG